MTSKIKSYKVWLIAILRPWNFLVMEIKYKISMLVDNIYKAYWN